MLQIRPFSRACLKELIGAQPDDKKNPPAVTYLCDYLEDLAAHGVIVEDGYVDRHYLDDYASYYAKSFEAPAPRCTRLHFFKDGEAGIKAAFAAAYQGASEREDAERNLSDAYLGFVVVRPLKGAPLGRTVLRTYPVEGRRHYAVVRPYAVHLAGLRLVVDGLAYQQQDRGAAVCASTALWSALQRVAHVAGHRTPTPAAITRAARSPYPASAGLNEVQMADALSGLGYVADHFAPGTNLPRFRANLLACLQSQLPVILLVYREAETGDARVTIGHAVTVTGYSDPGGVADVPYLNAPPLQLRSAGASVIYVHDDNLGSHAHYELFESSDSKQMLRRGRSSNPRPSLWQADEWQISGALVPKPDKLRLPLPTLVEIVLHLRHVLALPFPGIDISYQPRVTTGVEYKRALLDFIADPDRLWAFYSRVGLPRFVAVVSAFEGDTHLCDVVLDVSEVERNPPMPNVLAFMAPSVPVDSPGGRHMLDLARFFEAPVLLGPRTPPP